MQAKGLKTSFETETCSRCHGTGRYSYCADYGDKCFKCGGAGQVLSARGAAASRFYSESCQVALSDLKVGDRILVNSLTNDAKRSFSYIATVLEVKRSDSAVHWVSGSESGSYFPLTVVHSSDKFGQGGLSAKDDSKVRVYRSDDSERLAKALEYQNTLTKAGKVSKRKASK